MNYISSLPYNIISEYDISYIEKLPYNTIYNILLNAYKPSFDSNDRIVLYSCMHVTKNIIQYIQEAVDIIDISRNFIMIISPNDISAFAYGFENIIYNLNPTRYTYSINNRKYDIPKPLPKNFCFYPWLHLEVTPQGYYKPCCMYDGNIENMHISNNSISDAYFSKELSKLRNDFVNGIYPQKCKRCWDLEKHNNFSTRSSAQSKFKLLGRTKLLEEDNINNLISLDIKLGIECNLKCRICSPMYSSKILAEQYTANSNFFTKIFVCIYACTYSCTTLS